jgi:WD40 repeat protein
MGELQVWELETRKLKLSVPVGYDTIRGASWSPDGSLVAFACSDNSVRAVESLTGKQVFFQGAPPDWVLGTAFSTDGSHLVTVGRDGSMKLMQVKTQQFIDDITSITPGALKGGLQTVDRHPTKDELLIGGSTSSGRSSRFQGGSSPPGTRRMARALRSARASTAAARCGCTRRPMESSSGSWMLTARSTRWPGAPMARRSPPAGSTATCG